MASIEYVVNATDSASGVFEKIGLSADHLDQQLQDLSKRVATPEVDLEDSKFTLGMIRAAERLDKLSAKIADPKIEVDSASAQVEILRINAMLDRLDAKRVDVTVGVDRSLGSRLRGLFGGGGDAGGGGGLLGLVRGVPGVAGAAPVSAQAAGIGGLVGLAAVLAPSLLPFVLGGGLGLGAAGGAFALGSSANKQLQALQKSLGSAKGPQKKDIQAQIRALRQQSGPELAIFGAFQDLGGAAKDTFASALKSPGQGFSGGAGAPSFLTGLTGILKQLGGFIKTIGPELGQVFRASLPFVGMFVKFLEQAAKVLLPVFTQMLQQMIPFLPLIFKGLMNIVDGLAGMLKAIGPSGMQASAKIFVALTKAMAAVLVGFGHTMNWLAENIPTWVHDIAAIWDWLRHHTATVFDGIRHDIAHYWDMIFQNSIGMVIRLAHNVETQFNSLRHGIASLYDTIRHDIASAWDTIWNNTIGRIQRGVHDANDWFHRLPGMIVATLRGFGTTLWNLGHTWLSDLWNGIKSVAGGILNWFGGAGGFISKILGFLGKLTGHSPSGEFYFAGQKMMTQLAAGIKSRARVAASAAEGALGGVGRAGAGVQQWRGLVLKALGMEGLSPILAGRVLYQMQTESGGRANAINNWDSNAAAGDPSRGLMQVIGSTFAAYHWPGTSWNIYDPLANIAAAINYARHRYGPTLMSGGMGIGSGRGYAYGTLSASPGWALVGERGPEMVNFRGGERVYPGAGGNAYQITVNVPPSANQADVGRQIVGAIRQFELRSGAGWRK